MKHNFYLKSKKKQNQIQFLIGLFAFMVIMISICISWITEVYLFVILMISITLSIIAPFFDMPSLRKSGKMIYFSPLFIAEKPQNSIIKIHGGTLFDYCFVIDKKMNGKQRTNFIIQQYLQGLLYFIEKYENENELKIRGTSYILNERTAKKMGFEIIETDMLQKIILFYSYFNILISNSIAKNKLSFPNINETKTFQTDLEKLKERKYYIQKLNNSFISASRKTHDLRGV